MLRLPDREGQASILLEFANRHEHVAQRGYLMATLSDELGSEALFGKSWSEAYSSSLVGFETLAFDFHQWHSVRPLPGTVPWDDFVRPAYRLYRGLLANSMDAHGPSSDGLLYEIVAGLVAQRLPEVRMRLMSTDLDWNQRLQELPWDELLEHEMQRVFLLLARKDGGRRDLLDALEAIDRLHSLQALKEREMAALEADDRAAIRILGLYNAVRAVEIAARFLSGGESAQGRPVTEVGARDDVDAFISDARDLLSGVDARLRMKVSRLRLGLHALIQNSVYALRLPRSVETLVDNLASRELRPVLDTWYPQRQAIYAGSLLDPTRPAVVVSLPTSSGKTLLAEMAIAQALAEDAGRVVYMAPTRALVSQVARTLKRDMGSGVEVRIASPAYELDVVEDEILSDDFDVLVTTPEKFDLLFRIGHKSVSQVALVVVDEAHNLACEERGARLELLLASLRRERMCRFLLLTPFAKNAAQIASWLGGDAGASVHIDWRPNDRMVGATSRASRNKQPYLKMETLATAHGDFPKGVTASLGSLDPDVQYTRQDIAVVSAVRLAGVKRGGVLLLASSRDKAEQMAAKAAAHMPMRELRRDAQAVADYLDSEAGVAHPMRALLQRGVVYHHAGLSPEGRYLVERLVEESAADIVCATTTLAQGVHFPLSAAVIESPNRSVPFNGKDGETAWASRPIPPEEFWNIAGRVGRAMEDQLGTIVFSTTSAATRGTVSAYLEKDADRLVSSLMQVLVALHTDNLDLTKSSSLWKHKELSAFVQYIMHAIAVSGVKATRRDVDTLVRGSLVYQMLLKEDPRAAERLTRLAKGYIEAVSEAKGDSITWYSKMADGTGFSSGSVDLVYGILADSVSEDQWSPGRVFPMTGPVSEVLVRVVDALSHVPEVRLGERESQEPFNAERIAAVTTDWVNGASLSGLAGHYYGGNLSRATQHVHGVISTLMPWGLRAVHRVLTHSAEPVSDADVVPAMAMYGVRSQEAIGLRMLGVPRMAAEGLAAVARSEAVTPRDMKVWLESVPDTTWHSSLPRDAKVDGSRCALLWRVMEGIEPWSRLLE